MRQYSGFAALLVFIVQIFVFSLTEIKAQEQESAVYNDVMKILEEHMCIECHNTVKKEGNVDLSNYDELLKVLKPGHANQRLLIHAVQIKMMPALGQAPPLFPEDLKLIEN